jgi:hypothetical protein
MAALRADVAAQHKSGIASPQRHICVAAAGKKPPDLSRLHKSLHSLRFTLK